MLENMLEVDPAIVRGYARGVADELARGPLTLDRRDRLIGRAKHLGLSRFEAALVLAVAERNQPPVSDPTATITRANTSRWSIFGVAAALQFVIAGAAWLLIR